MDKEPNNTNHHKEALKKYGLNPKEWKVLESFQTCTGKIIFQNLRDHEFQLESPTYKKGNQIKELRLLSI